MPKGTYNKADRLFSKIAHDTQDIEFAYRTVYEKYGKKLADEVYENIKDYNYSRSTILTGEF